MFSGCKGPALPPEMHYFCFLLSNRYLLSLHSPCSHSLHRSSNGPHSLRQCATRSTQQPTTHLGGVQASIPTRFSLTCYQITSLRQSTYMARANLEAFGSSLWVQVLLFQISFLLMDGWFLWMTAIVNKKWGERAHRQGRGGHQDLLLHGSGWRLWLVQCRVAVRGARHDSPEVRSRVRCEPWGAYPEEHINVTATTVIKALERAPCTRRRPCRDGWQAGRRDSVGDSPWTCKLNLIHNISWALNHQEDEKTCHCFL